jgi:hypothetical protein
VVDVLIFHTLLALVGDLIFKLPGACGVGTVLHYASSGYHSHNPQEKHIIIFHVLCFVETVGYTTASGSVWTGTVFAMPNCHALFGRCRQIASYGLMLGKTLQLPGFAEFFFPDLEMRCLITGCGKPPKNGGFNHQKWWFNHKIWFV